MPLLPPFFAYSHRMKSRALHLQRDAEPPESLVRALARIFSEQLGSEVMLSCRRLRKAGFTGTSAQLGEHIRRLLGGDGFPDPLGRGVWRLRREGRNGNRRKYYVVLVRGGAG